MKMFIGGSAEYVFGLEPEVDSFVVFFATSCPPHELKIIMNPTKNKTIRKSLFICIIESLPQTLSTQV